jgi:hypothetical protein
LGTSVITRFHQLILIIVQLLNPVVIKITESRFYSKENFSQILLKFSIDSK